MNHFVNDYREVLATGVKWCNLCKRTLAVDEFSCDKSRADGRATKCKKCDAARQVEYKRRKLSDVQNRAAEPVTFTAEQVAALLSMLR